MSNNTLDTYTVLREGFPSVPYFRPTPEGRNLRNVSYLVHQHLRILSKYDPDHAIIFSELTALAISDYYMWSEFDWKCRKEPAGNTFYWLSGRQKAQDVAEAARLRGGITREDWDAIGERHWRHVHLAARKEAEAIYGNTPTPKSACWWAAQDALCCVQHTLAELPDNPWYPLVQLWNNGVVPIGVVGNDFVVYVHGGAGPVFR